MNRTTQTLKYLWSDFLAAAIAWSLFYTFRKLVLEPQKFGYDVELVADQKFFVGLALVPLCWVGFYALTGFYRDVYRKSRLRELIQTFVTSVIGVVIVFFALLLDDEIATYTAYYKSLAVLFGLHFTFTAVPRFVLSSITAHKIHNRIIGFNTLIVGSNEKALNLFNELTGNKRSSGYKVLGFVHINGGDGSPMKAHCNHLGHVRDVTEIIRQQEIEEVILAIESSEHEGLGKIMNALEKEAVNIKVIPDMYDILTGQVKMTSIFGAPLIAINPEIMPAWQQSAKRAMDISVSLLALTVFWWIYLFLALGVKLSSKGPIFYSHERIGRNGKPFRIFKFRSMYVNAEQHGPALSSQHDSRITPFGRFLRKSRLDELPQFYNVLIGDMSLVGPRPERQHFIDQIMEKAPHYVHLHKVRPGITSWGQVKYGYAENVEQMVERLKYDILYLENMSLSVDFKILIYTVLTVLRGDGK